MAKPNGVDSKQLDPVYVEVIKMPTDFWECALISSRT